MEAIGQLTESDTIAAGVMVTEADPVIPETVALTVVLPAESGASNPVVLTAPIFVFEECQVTPEVRLFVLPSE